ncbi:hypothetical protein [Clavibacter tessellarius]|uniref:hypothetical protein n=1 Tax=Clavibacter tessellarius TaxID=31965 RepID=UPI00324472F2
MDVTIRSAVHGGTPNGLDPVAIRRALRRALGPVSIDGVTELDLFLRVGGPLKSAEGHGGIHGARYFAKAERFMANLVVPLSDIAALGSADAVGHLLLVLAERVAARVAPDDPRARDELRAAMISVAHGLSS